MKTQARLLMLSLLLLSRLCAAAVEPTVLENSALRVEIDSWGGQIAVRDKSGGAVWRQPPPQIPRNPKAPPLYRVVRTSLQEVALERIVIAGKGIALPMTFVFTLPDANAPDLRVELRTVDVRQKIVAIKFLDPFILEAPRGALAVADYSDGHLYPLDTRPFPRSYFAGDRLDMPWVGLCDLESGRGYMLLLETSDDAEIRMPAVTGPDGQERLAPQVTWRPQKGAFGYWRRMLFHFESRGGYVAFCKRYRQYARERGLLVTLSQKVRANPNLARLFGAPDVWGAATLDFARQAKTAGVDKMLIHGRPNTPAELRGVNALGYLTSEYDNYADIMQAENGWLDFNHANLPGDAVLMANGERMKAWLTWDKKQFMKRCPALWAAAGERTANRVLGEWPFLGRFVDVTTAEPLYECYDPKHPLTRTQKRDCGPVLLNVFRRRGLVTGGEHGVWWCVPTVDYIEGMQSGSYTSWPAGYLRRPKTKDEEFTSPSGTKLGKWANYAKWGIGHEWRAPLWELVFHDCIVSTWYWGDSSDFLLEAAPEVTPKKDAFNILYGTIPLLWANNEGSWVRDRRLFMNTYRNTCKLHEMLATAELLSHEFVTADHGVQRTRFSDGTVCLVNFGEKPYRATAGGKSYELPQNGWVVEGPKVRQSLALEGGKAVTTIQAPGYSFSDGGAAPVALIAEGQKAMRIVVDQAAARVVVRPADVSKTFKLDGATLYKLDAQGRRQGVWRIETAGDGAIAFGPVTEPGAFMLISN